MSTVLAGTSAPDRIAYAVRRVPRRVPCTVYDDELDVMVAFAADAVADVVGDDETAVATFRSRAVGLAGVTSDFRPAATPDEADAIARLFDVEAQLTITQRRCIVIGAYGWSVAGVVDVVASTFLIATYPHSQVAWVDARTHRIGRRRVAIDIASREPASALRLSIVSANARRTLDAVSAPILDDRLASSTSGAERDRLLAARAGGYEESSGRLVAWLEPPDPSHVHFVAPPSMPARAAATDVVSSAPESAWWEPAGDSGRAPEGSAAPEWWETSNPRGPVPACANCGTAVRAGARFCGVCGGSLAAPQ